MNTKERITEEAMTLFAQHGYKGTSVKQIADAVGIKDASLYKHFRSKQDIMCSIVWLIGEKIENLSDIIGLPTDFDDKEKVREQFDKLAKSGLKPLVERVFLFYLTDPHISRFWRIAHMEQYSNSEIYEMFRTIFMEEAITYQTNLFAVMIEEHVLDGTNPQVMAYNFYSPILLLLMKYSGMEDKADEAIKVLDDHVDEFLRVYGGKQHE